MKLATYRDDRPVHRRDGRLVVVNREGTQAVDATSAAPTLQTALDSWSDCEPKLQKLFKELESGAATEAFDFDPKKSRAPLPRAYGWMDGSAYINHIVLVRKARGAEPPATLETDPLMYQGGSDQFMGPHEDILVQDLDWGVDFESEVVVVTDDVPMGVPATDALKHIKLLMICNDVSLRNLIPPELAKGFGFLQSKPSSAFAPLAVTPDELGEAWDNGRVHLPLVSVLNDKTFGNPEAGTEMHFNFGQLIAHAARTRPLTAGTLIGSGTISNEDREKGSSCIAEQRMIEKIDTGTITTPFMQYNDRIRIEMKKDGKSIFGLIDQVVKPYEYSEKVAP